MKLFSGSSNLPLAESIAAILGIPVSPIEIFVFPDGEQRIKANIPVLDEDVVIVQSTSTPVDTYYMELFFMVDAMKRSGARSVTAVVPYLGYQRQDHVFRDGEAVSLDVCITLMQAIGVDRILIVEPHSIKIPEEFKIPLIDLSAIPLFAQVITSRDLDRGHTVLVSPDMGGIRRIKILAEITNLPYITVVKNRDLDTGSIESNQFGDEASTSLTYQTFTQAILVDDMASSGKTLVEAGKLVASHGVKHIEAMVTHPIFSSDAPQLLANSVLERVYVTDSVFVPLEKRFDKLEILSISGMIAESLK